MKFLIAVFVLGILSISGKAQTLEVKLANSACGYIDSINLAKVITPQDKKSAIIFIFAKAVAANQDAIIKDNRFSGLNDYDQGKKIGQLMGQTTFSLMVKQCPKFKVLIN
jgi:hypothetical protein